MWWGFGLRLHATSCWHRTGAAMARVRACLKGGLAEGRRTMYVKIICLQDALYKAIKLSVSETVHRGYSLCLWRMKIHFSCWFHWELCQRVVSFVGVQRKKKPWSSTSHYKGPEREIRAVLMELWSQEDSKQGESQTGFCFINSFSSPTNHKLPHSLVANHL